MKHSSSRVIDIKSRRTSMKLTPCEWKALDTICQREKINRKNLFDLIDANKDPKLGFTSSIRLFTIIYYKNSIIYASQTSNNNEFKSPIHDAINQITK
ncbi:MAG: hypothetical protein E7005_03215 [Alphaproteobacteria bacterium]|nr:hypothetical protein [Alphaproteobacteria bacterium]